MAISLFRYRVLQNLVSGGIVHIVVTLQVGGIPFAANRSVVIRSIGGLYRWFFLLTTAYVPGVRRVVPLGTALLTRDTFIYAVYLLGIDNTLAVACLVFSVG